MASIITLTTDFGVGSGYVAQMKGVILSLAPEVTLVDISHTVPPQGVRHAAVVMAETVPRFPPGSIHVCVVDPGVGTDRAILAVAASGRWLIAPDNGVLSWVGRDLPVDKRVRLTRTEFWLPEVSETFHGRDIMAPVAAHISRGVTLDALGEPTDSWAVLSDPPLDQSADHVRGQVLFVDEFGNLITNIRREHLAAADPGDVQVAVGDRLSIPLVRTYGASPSGALVALYGSNGYLEVARVDGNASRDLQCRAGQSVTVAWNPEPNPRADH